MRVETSVSGTETASSRVRAVADRVDLRQVSPAILRTLRAISSETFDTEGRGTWRPLSLAWKRDKARRGKSTKILQETGTLRRSLTTPRAPGSYARTTPTMITFGTRVPYAKYHPDRPILSLSTEERRTIVDLVRDHIAARKV